MRLYRIYIAAFIVFLITCKNHSQAQVEIARAEDITAPPAPTQNADHEINLTDDGSVEYLAENEITLLPGFHVEGGSSPGSDYFLAKIVPPVSYAELKDKLDGSFCGTIANTLYFKYTEKYNTGLLKYQIYDYQRNEMIPLVNQTGQLALNKTLGDNFFALDLTLASGFVGTTDLDSFYILEVENDKGEKFYLRFKYLTSVNY